MILFFSDFTQVANLACSVSSNVEGVKLVRVITKKVHDLCPQVSNIELLNDGASRQGGGGRP